MEKKECPMCRLIEGIVILGAFNLGMVGIANFNVLAALLGNNMQVVHLVYIVIGFCAIIQMTKSLNLCPCVKKETADSCKK